jgi:TrmH family RNA methyltransferase
VNLLATARDLKRRKAREKRSLFAAEGVRSVEELLKSNLHLEGALVSPALWETERGELLRRQLDAKGIEVVELSEKDFAGVADTESPQGVMVVAKVPQGTMSSVFRGERIRIVVLDGVQDPGNAGTILRTAAALGAAATFTLPGTVDVWNPKVIRGSMGAQFTHPVFAVSAEELANVLRRESIELWATEAGGDQLGDAKAPAKLAIAVGNEGAGLSSTVRELATRIVGLPLAAGVESLNVAVATGIILYELNK